MAPSRYYHAGIVLPRFGSVVANANRKQYWPADDQCFYTDHAAGVLRNRLACLVSMLWLHAQSLNNNNLQVCQPMLGTY